MFKLFLLLFAASTLVLPMAACAVINDQLDPKPKADEPNANETLVEGTTAPAWKVKLEERRNAAKLRREELLKEAQKRREERLERRKKFQEDYAKWLRLTPERKREELKKWLEGRKKERKQRIAERQQKIRAQIEAVKNRRNGVVVTTQAPEVEANATASPPAEIVTPDQVQSVLNGNVGNSANALGGSTVEEVGNGTQALGNETETNGGAGNAAGNVESATTVGNAETLVNAVENEKTLAGNAGGCPCPTENQAVKQVDPPALADAKQSAEDSQQQAQGNSQNSVNSDEQKAETGTANQRQDAKGELTVDSAEPNNSESVNAEPSTENDASPVQSSQNQPSAPVEKESSSTDSNPPVNEQPNNAAKAPVAVADSVKVNQKNEREKAKKGVGQTANNVKTHVPAAASKKEAKLKAKQ